MTTEIANTAPQVSESAETPVNTGESTTQPTQAEIRRLKLKVDGQEMELPEDEVISMAQRAKAGDRAMREAAQIRQRETALIKRIKSDPFGVLSDPALGFDVKELVQKYIHDQYSEASLTPEQKELRDLRMKVKAREEEDNNRLAAEQEKMISEKASVIQQQLETSITDVLSTSGLPKTNYTVQRIVHYMQIALQQGYDHVTPKSVLPLVKEDFVRAQNDLYAASDEDTLIQLLGDDLLSKVSKAYLKKTQKGAKETLEKPFITSKKAPEKKGAKSLEKWLRS